MKRIRIRQDDGQVSLAVILLSIAVLAGAIGAFIFGEANDVRARAQKAGDAGALAAARDVREAFIRQYAVSHVPPTNVSPPIIAVPSVVVGMVNNNGYASAAGFARKNESSLTTYKPLGDRITVDTKSNTVEVSSPIGKKAQRTLTSPASATAQVGTSGLVCRAGTVVRDPDTGTVISWEVICTGNGHSATAHYVGSTLTSDVMANMDQWRSLLKVKLVE